MTLTAPLIDGRDASQVLRQILGDPVQALPGLRDFYTPAWTGRDGDDPGYVLAFVFSKLMELLLGRLNRAPEKNFIAFLNLLGIDRLPGNPARTPVKFFLPDGNTTGGFVPSGSQVVTGTMPSGTTYVFETDNDLFITSVHLTKVFVLLPAADGFQDASFSIDAPAATAAIVLGPSSATIQIEHSLYLSHDTLFSFAGTAELTVDVNVLQTIPPFLPSAADWAVVWESFVVDEKGMGSWQPMQPQAGSESAANFEASGQIVFPNFKGVAASMLAGSGQQQQARWIRGRLATPMLATLFSGDASRLPRLKSLLLGLTRRRTQLQLDAAFNNSIPLDLSKDFAPLGSQPKIADTFYFASNEIFSQPGAVVTLHVEISQGIVVVPSPDLELSWEIWTGQVWEPVPVSDASANLSIGFAGSPPSGQIQFTLPLTVAPTTVNGVTSYWARVRILQANYGEPARYQPKPGSSPVEFVFVPDSLHPPMLSRITVDYQMTYPPTAPQQAVTLNSFEYVDRSAVIAGSEIGFRPFEPEPDAGPALYLGFDGAFAEGPISVFIKIEDQPANTSSASTAPVIIWEYSAQDSSWHRLTLLDDGSNQFTASGVVSFVNPSDSAPREKFGQRLFWVRARIVSPPVGHLVSGIYLNTVEALNRTTITNEVLGSGNGTPGQTLFFSQRPVLPGELVYVEEPEMPSQDVITGLRRAEEIRLGRPLTREEQDQLVLTREDASGAIHIWVLWEQVKNFLSSGPQSRHYVLDRVAGTLIFGDQVSGMLPPINRDNVQAFLYQAGGGSAASREVTAGSVKQLRSPLPFVGGVSNLLDALGGSDPEAVDDVLARGPQTIKNKDRAVTAEDYVWLAKQASTLVKQAKCLPTRNDRLQFEAGSVSVLVVPASDDLRPLPSQELLRIVREYEVARSLPGIKVYTIPPQYQEVRVAAQVVPINAEEASIVQGRILAALNVFLHPVNGGPKGNGWDFGRSVPISEIYQVMEDVPGVDVVLSAELNENPSLDAIDIGNDELPAPGPHNIAMTLEGK